MVNESGSISFLHVAAPRDVVPFSTGAPSRGRAAVENPRQASAGHPDRPGFSALFAQIRVLGEQRAETAAQLRQFQSSLHRADDLLEQIKEQLGQIIKQYPPFAQDDPQRIAYLNSISGLRKQLDALTFPPEHRPQAQLSQMGEGQDTLPAVPPHPLRDVPAIPELDPRTAGDAEVKSALDAVTRVQAMVHDVQAGMWQDVVRYVGTSNLGPDGDSSARTRAGEVQHYVASHPSPGGIGVGVRAILSIG